MANYLLTLDKLYSSTTAQSITLTYNDNGGETVTLTNKNGSKSFTAKLEDFSYSKAIYQPGQIRFKILLSWTDTEQQPTLSEVKEIFQSAMVHLTSDNFHIADNYHVFNIQMERQPNATLNMYVQIEAYSPDQYLTLDKYCKAYTGKKLYKDIIANQKLWPTNLSIFSSQDNLNKLLSSNLHFLEFTVTQDNKKETYEFIQPYLVQYNESFFDFLVRITNRCGEFFYYENGKFNVGWPVPNPKDMVQIDQYTSIRYMARQNTARDTNSIADIHNDYTQPPSASTASIMRNSELASDEHLASLPPKDQYTQWQDFANYPAGYWISAVTGAFSETSLLDMIESFTWNTITTRVSASHSADSTNDNYEETFFANENYQAERIYQKDNKNNIHLYSSASDGKKFAFNLKFYTDIQNGIAQAESSRIHVVLENNFYPISLGSLIYFDNTSDLYIVVQIDHKIQNATPGHPGDFLEIEAIPYNSEQTVYPPAAHVSPIRRSSAQPAIVTHNLDPLKMGRVRVRYPWQQKSDDPSPWIRITQPMASQNSGFRFLPEKGDEAMINYENGNIEKPYVEGMLFSCQRQTPYAHTKSNTRVLSSVNGHSIVFSDPGGDSYFKSFFPILGTLSTFFPNFDLAKEIKFPLGSDAFKQVSGGIEFKDKFGLYSISMSSNKRSISIDSPLGKVNINAFTGISISAPNGDIKIEGKNVSIVAGNNLTLTSGKNRKFLPKSKDIVPSITNFLASKITVVDLSVLRTIFEAVIRPIAGTLRISSNRYLCIEAGKGSTQIIGRRTVKNFSPWKTVQAGFGAYNINPNPDNKVFTSDIPGELRAIKDGITTLFNTHKRQSIVFARLSHRYQHLRRQLQLRPNLDTFITDSNIPSVRTVYQNIQNNQITQPLMMQPDIDVDDPNIIAEVQNLVSSINHITQTMYQGYYDEASQLDRQFPNNSVMANPEIRSKVNDLVHPVLPAVAIDTRLTTRRVRRIQIDKSTFRNIMYLALNYLVKNQKTENGQNYTDSISSTGIGSPKGYTTEDWRKFVDNISATSTAKDILLSAAKKLVKADSLEGMLDQYVWDNQDQGKILLSDEAGKTLNIQNQTLNVYMQSRNQVDDTEHIISEIKTILHQLD